MIVHKSIRDRSHGSNFEYYNHITEIHKDKCVYKYLNKDLYNKIKEIYSKIKDIEYVQEMKFKDGLIISPLYNTPIYKNSFSSSEKKIIKNQLIDFLKKINSKKVCHKDLHVKNALFHNREKLIIIDWEFIDYDDGFYDINGLGYSPLRTGNMNVFSKHEYSFYNFLDKKISPKDFI